MTSSVRVCALNLRTTLRIRYHSHLANSFRGSALMLGGPLPLGASMTASTWERGTLSTPHERLAGLDSN
jgi:hypothetical protein